MTDKVGTITGTTKIPKLWDKDGNFKRVKLIAWSNSQVTWELIDEENGS